MNKKQFLFILIFELFFLISINKSEENKLPKKLGVNELQSKMFFTWTPSWGSYMFVEMKRILAPLGYKGKDVSSMSDPNEEIAGVETFYEKIIKKYGGSGLGI